jgi:methionyl-tRNA synthetase
MTENDEMYKKFWPADLHLVGKEIVRFHAITWPALLMALDIPLPKRVFGHGWLLLGGEKLSKSKTAKVKEVLDPRILAPRYSADSIRYFLSREMQFGQDGIYSTENYLKRINTDLCNDFGNLVNRTLSMTKKYFGSIVPKQGELTEVDKEFIQNVENARDSAVELMAKLDVSKALIQIFEIFDLGNKYIDATQPWVLAKSDTVRLETVMYDLLEAIKIGTILAQSFIPEGTSKVLNAYGFENGKGSFEDIKTFGLLKTGLVLGEVPMLYPRLDIEKELESLAQIE